MADSICRALRDGALEGEHSPSLTIKDTTASPYGFDVFTHVLSQLSSLILAGKSQSRGLVLVSYSRSPSFYLDLLKTRGVELASSHNWLYILDCYTDPLGWKHQLVKSGIVEDVSPANLSAGTCIIQDVKDVEKLYSLILESGTGLVGQGKVRFSVAIDSVTEMRRHVPVSKIAGLISDLRSHDQISSIFWLLHSDIHEVKLTASLEYLSSMVTSVEPLNQPHDSYVRDLGSLSLDNSFGKGKLHTRFKRRNGRLRIMNEELHMEESGIKFTSFSAEDGLVSQGFVPKVQFNLELSEKEKMERAKVVLPFEHQGTGKPIQIYDGRKSLAPESTTEAVTGDSQSKPEEESNGGVGEIIYFRDSDDERPDSDEDPDDDLDI